MLARIVPRRHLVASTLGSLSGGPTCLCPKLNHSLNHPQSKQTNTPPRCHFSSSASTSTPSQPSSSLFRLSSRSSPSARKTSPLPSSGYEDRKEEEDAENRTPRYPNETMLDDLDLAGGNYYHYSLYQPKRQWPPDMSKLSPKHQFRLERKYRRRAALKYARPRWVKWTKMAQWSIIAFVLVYSVLFMDFGTEKHPLDEFRKEFFEMMNDTFAPRRPKPVSASSQREENRDGS